MSDYGKQVAGGGRWKQDLFLELGRQVDPFLDRDLFRSRHTGYQGDLAFWKVPSPEPKLSAALITSICESLRLQAAALQQAARQLTMRLASQFDPSEVLFVSILRAGVPITDWLQRFWPGSKAAITSLFVGAGIDQVALNDIRSMYPDRKPIFVDGWTGKGGVSRELQSLGAGPLAVLIDPWGVADFSGTRADLLCASAMFTGPTTLGFSRSFIVDHDRPFQAYRFSSELMTQALITAWQDIGTCAASGFDPSLVESQPCNTSSIQHETPMRVHSNEVCRALINSNPDQLYFRGSHRSATSEYGLLVELAEQQAVPCLFDQGQLERLDTSVACTLNLSN